MLFKKYIIVLEEALFAEFTGKYLCQSLFLITLQAETFNFIKKRF